MGKGRALSFGVALVVSVAAGNGVAAAGSRSARTFVPTTAYVTGYKLTPIDTATNTAAAPIDILGNGIAITPDGETAYEAGNGGMRSIDLATRTLGPWIDVGKNPDSIAISPDGRTAYVKHVDDTVRSVDLATGVASDSFPVYDKIGGFALTPDGTTLYFADTRISSVIAVDTADLTHRTMIPVGIRTADVEVSPDGKTAYFTARNGTVVPVDTATNTAESPIPVTSDPLSYIAIAPNGATAYVVDYTAGTVIPIELVGRVAEAPISVGVGLGAIAFIPDGQWAYVVRSDAYAVPIDAAINKAGTPIPVSLTPIDIAVTPDQAPIARFKVVPAPAGSPTSFDASRSIGVSQPVSSYQWKFGDRTSAFTTHPIINHVYAVGGTYRVTLVVTDRAGTSTEQVFIGRMMSRNGGPSARQSHRITIT